MSLYVPEILQYTWENKPATAPLGQIICVTDIGENGQFVSRKRHSIGSTWHNTKTTTAPVLVTATTTTVTVATFNIKAVLLVQTVLSKYICCTLTNNGNLKTLQWRLMEMWRGHYLRGTLLQIARLLLYETLTPNLYKRLE